MSFGPYSPSRRALFVAGVVHKSEAYAAVEHVRLAVLVIDLAALYDAPVHVLLEEGRHICPVVQLSPHILLLYVCKAIRAGREGVIPVLLLVDADPVYLVLIVPAEMISHLPIEVLRDVADEIGLRVEGSLVDAVERIVAVEHRIRLGAVLYGLLVVAQAHTLEIVVGSVAVETVEVEGLVDIVRH